VFRLEKDIEKFQNAYLPLLTFTGDGLQILPSLDKLIIKDVNLLCGAKVFDIEWIYFPPISFLPPLWQ
jgi:hypothetical protein